MINFSRLGTTIIALLLLCQVVGCYPTIKPDTSSQNKGSPSATPELQSEVTATVLLPAATAIATSTPAANLQNPPTDKFVPTDRPTPEEIYKEIVLFMGGGVPVSFVCTDQEGAHICLEDNGLLLLYGFNPNETVRIFEYDVFDPSAAEGTAILSGWQEYKVGGNGELKLQSRDTQDTWYCYGVIGDVSGATDLDGCPLISPLSTSSVQGYIIVSDSCPGGYDINSEPVWRYDDPSKVLRVMPSGTKMKIIEGKVVSDGSLPAFWYLVELEDGSQAWVMDDIFGCLTFQSPIE